MGAVCADLLSVAAGSQGCPCPVMGPGGLSEFEQVLRAPAGRIHFVGTETAWEWKGFVSFCL